MREMRRRASVAPWETGSFGYDAHRPLQPPHGAAPMAEFEDRAFVDSLVFPEPTCVLNAPYERQQKAQLIVKRGHAANEAGDFSVNDALFFERRPPRTAIATPQ